MSELRFGGSVVKRVSKAGKPFASLLLSQELFDAIKSGEFASPNELQLMSFAAKEGGKADGRLVFAKKAPRAAESVRTTEAPTQKNTRTQVTRTVVKDTSTSNWNDGEVAGF